MSNSITTMIEVVGLKKSFGTHAVLRDISLEVPKGGVVALIGPSGSGKSTLLRTLNLLTLPDSGYIRVGASRIDFTAGQRMPRDRELAAFRARTGMVFQNFNLFPHMSAEANVMEGPVTVQRMKKPEARALARELLAKVGLADRAEAMPDQLSGGQKQRVAIARALATQPEMLLCDEPTSALDPLTTKSMLALLTDINKKLGVTIIIITHELSVVQAICSHVAVISEGRLAESGAVADVFGSPRSAVTKLLLGREE